MFCDLLSEKNNLQMQLSDFEDDESIKIANMAILRYKSKNKSLKSGYCKRCGSYRIIGWGGYSRKVRHMYNPTEHTRARRFRCKTCGKTVAVLPEGVRHYKRFANKDYHEMVEQRCSRGSGYRRLSRRGKIKYCSHVTMWRQMQKTGQQTLEAFFDLGDLPFSGIIIIDERWLPMGNGIFHFGCTAIDGITGRTVLAEEYPAFTEKEAEEFLRLLSKLVDVEFLVADDSAIQAVINKVFPDAIRQYCIFHIKRNIKKAFHVPKLMKLSDEAINAKEEILNVFNANTSEEAIRRLAVLVEKRHTLPPMAQDVVNRLASKIEGLFQYLDHDIPKTSNQVEQTFSLFQPIIDAAKSFSTGVGNFFRTIMFYKNFHFYSSGPNKDKNTMHSMGVASDSMFDFIELP
jgi:transposase-like protein/predicted small metal-binding protein